MITDLPLVHDHQQCSQIVERARPAHRRNRSAGYRVVGVVLYATGVTGELSEGGSDGAAQGATIWGAALFMGVGAVLVVLGVIRRRRRSSSAVER